MIIVLSVIIALLVATNATLFYFLLRKSPIQTKRMDVTAQQLINDLTATGNALVRLERIAPSDVFLRSPKL
jgi:hypothetical protein